MSLEPYQITKDAYIVHSPPRDRDPRGIFWMFEPPSATASYFIGVDPTQGITGWHRDLRTQDDYKTDNAAVQVIRKGDPDVQAAEWVGPVDPYDLAPFCNAIGRLYGGSNQDGQAHMIIEVWPGPGFSTQRELINKYGYTNMFVWRYLDSMIPRRTQYLGWQSSQKSVRDLWIKGVRHTVLKKCRIHSDWLVEEMSNCQSDPELMRGRAGSGKHDDRVSAYLMAIWAANDWDIAVETIPTESIPDPNTDWRQYELSYEDMMEKWDRIMDSVFG